MLQNFSSGGPPTRKQWERKREIGSFEISKPVQTFELPSLRARNWLRILGLLIKAVHRCEFMDRISVSLSTLFNHHTLFGSSTSVTNGAQPFFPSPFDLQTNREHIFLSITFKKGYVQSLLGQFIKRSLFSLCYGVDSSQLPPHLSSVLFETHLP